MRTHFARPNWREVFTKIAAKHPSSTVGMIFRSDRLSICISWCQQQHSHNQLMSIDQLYAVTAHQEPLWFVQEYSTAARRRWPKNWRTYRTRWATRRRLASISTRSTSDRKNPLILMICIALGTGTEEGIFCTEAKQNWPLSSWSGAVHSIKKNSLLGKVVSTIHILTKKGSKGRLYPNGEEKGQGKELIKFQILIYMYTV